MTAVTLPRLILRRLGLGAVTLLIVSAVVFAATEVLPGDAARAVLGRDATPAALTALRLRLHLDEPLIAQYWNWLTGLLAGNPGASLVNGRPVLDLVMPRVRNSLVLLALAGAVGVPLSVLAGIGAASRQGSLVDNVTSILALAAAAIPEFVVAFLIIIMFATNILRWFPAVSMVPPHTSIFARPRILALPVLTLVLVIFPYMFRMMRASMVDILRSDYIEMARLKGLSSRRILLVHALPNAVAPTVQVVALTFAYLAGGVVLVEYVFAFPGIGQSLVFSVFSRDIPVIQFEVLLLSLFYVALNIIADTVTILLTPRLRARSWQAT